MNESELEKMIAEFLLAKEEGRAVDRVALLARHPDLAPELSIFFENYDRFRVTISNNELDLPTIGMAEEIPTTTIPVDRPGQVRGREFGNYELLSEIARGGMGIVYRARQKRLNRMVALKMILSGPLADASAIQRFQREAESAAHLDHSGIVPIHEVGEYAGVHYYTMSLIEGRSLAQLLADGPLAPEAAALLLKKVATAVAHAHTHHVVHRDLKPANILLDPQGEPRITDFGLAKRLDGGQELTASGEIIGTLQYMAPEQALGHGEQVGAACDIYALGAVLYAMLTGRPPFQGEHHMDVWLQVMEAEPVAPRKRNRAVPRDLERICLRCLEKDPRRRYASADELVDDLDAFLRGEPLPVATSRFLDSIRRLPRRCPALCAHLLGLGVTEVFRQLRFFAQGFDVVRADWRYHFQFTAVFAMWALCSVVLQAFSDRIKGTRAVGFIWSTVDVLFLTLVLLLAQGPIGPLYSAFALLIVASVSFFRVRLTAYMTVTSILAFITVIAVRPPEKHPPHYSFVLVAILAVIGTIMGYHVRRMRLLSDYYERRL